MVRTKPDFVAPGTANCGPTMMFARVAKYESAASAITAARSTGTITCEGRTLAPMTRFSYQVGGRWSIQGRARSSSALSVSTVRSSAALPTTCTPMGRPSDEKPAGTDAAGWPVTLNGQVQQSQFR